MIKSAHLLCTQQRLRSAWALSFYCVLNEKLRTQAFPMFQAMNLIGLGGNPGFSESSLSSEHKIKNVNFFPHPFMAQH